MHFLLCLRHQQYFFFGITSTNKGTELTFPGVTSFMVVVHGWPLCRCSWAKSGFLEPRVATDEDDLYTWIQTFIQVEISLCQMQHLHGTYSNTDINRYMDTQVHIGTSGSGTPCKALTPWIPLNVTFTQFQSHCVNYIRLCNILFWIG